MRLIIAPGLFPAFQGRRIRHFMLGEKRPQSVHDGSTVGITGQIIPFLRVTAMIV
jgi:hypothetical protein